MTKKIWKPEEDAIIRREYKAGGSLAVQAILTYRSKAAIQSRAIVIGLKVAGNDWSPEEDRAIADLYPDGGSGAVMAVIGRTKQAIQKRASKLGVERANYRGPRGNKTVEDFRCIPAMDDADREACRLLATWRGPVTGGVMRWRV